MEVTMVAKAIAILALLFATISPQAEAVHDLFGGQALTAGQFLQNGPYKFIMQADCNLVLYTGNRPLWSSGTVGKGNNCRAAMQRDANLVVYSGNQALWASGTARAANNYHLTVQLDGNVVIYDSAGKALWATNTVQHASKKL